MSKDIEAIIAESAADIAEMAARGLPPFSRLPQYLPLNRNAEFLVNWGEEDRREFVESVVAGAKFSVGGERYRDEVAFQKEKQLAAEQAAILRSRTQPISANRLLLLKAFPHKERKRIAIARIEDRIPEYSLDKTVFERTTPGLVAFSKPFLTGNKTWIAIDVGAGKTDGILDSYIGLQKPFYSVRPASFYGTVIRGIYATPPEFRAMLDETLDLLEVVLPVFEKKMSNALEGL